MGSKKPSDALHDNFPRLRSTGEKMPESEGAKKQRRKREKKEEAKAREGRKRKKEEKDDPDREAARQSD